MGTAETTLCEIVEKVRSWIHPRAGRLNVSRVFWMPDRSCRVCYECDLQFTIFNRRHHCRICGRVFCRRCTLSTVPAVSPDGWKNCGEERERIRVCNFCFNQWEQEIVATQYNGIQLSVPAISPSPSVTSLALSSKSSVNSNTSLSSMPYSNGPCQEINSSSALSPVQAHGLQAQLDRIQDVQYLGENTNFILGVESGGSSPNFYRSCTNRSDDEDDEYGKCADDPRQDLFRQSEKYFSENDGIGLDPGYIFHRVHPSDFSSQSSMDQADWGSGGGKALNSGENIDGKSPILQTDMPLECQFSTTLERSGEESEGTENADECNDVSSMFEAPRLESEQPVDFENNGLIWVPPEPEDEDDEIENSLLDDEDEDDRGGWGLPRTGSFSNNENKSKDRLIDDHRKAMRAVVDGHFRALVAQLLKGEEVPVGEENDNESWLEIVTSLSWQAATLIKPDTSKGGGMDPGGYVKVKCIACGHRRESEVIKGVVCKKNIAHRRMTSKYKNPRLLLLGGALEYQRVSNQLSSLDTLLQQEMEHLKMTVAKIEAHHPNVLLVEKTVSRYAQEYLLAKEISLVLNVKKPLLERIARCTGAQVASSVDNLTALKVGHCELFHVEKFMEEHGSAGQPGKKLLKTLMFFEGCPKPLGCTVLLKGATGDELKKVKRVVQYAVFAAYHLALETSFLADEGATLPELPFKSPITVALPDKQSSSDRSISTVPGFTVPVLSYASTGDAQVQNTLKDATSTLPVLPNNPPNLNVGTSMSLSQTPSNAFAGVAKLPQITVGSNTFSPTCMSTESTGIQEQDICLASEGLSPPHALSGHLIAGLPSSIRKGLDKEVHGGLVSCGAGPTNFGLEEKLLNESVTDDGLTTSIGSGSLKYQITTDEAPSEVQWKDQGKVDDHMMAKFFLDQKTVECNKQDAVNFEEQGSSREDFPPSPSDQQSILVSLSTRCVWKGTVCERAHLFRIKYYGSFDKPLGRFIRDDLFDQNYHCPHCDSPTEAHVHCYTHRQGSLTISVRRLTESILPGEREGKIWMWHRCLKCARKNGVPQATRRVVMSDAAWGLSFGKFLELSFSNHAAASRVASCGHSLHRDCLRFYGFGRMVACFRYAAIQVHSVHLPPPKLEFNNPNQQDWLRKEALEVTDGAELFFAEVYDALRQIGEKIASCASFHTGLKVPESRRRISELEGILQKEKAEFEELLRRAVTKDWRPGQPFADILQLNRLRRGLLIESYLWDHRLRFLDSTLRVKNSVGSNSSLQDLNASLPKESIQNIASEKIVESHRIGKNDSNAGGATISRVDNNGCMLNGNGQENGRHSDNVLFKDICVDNNSVITDGSVQSASMLRGFPESLLVGHFMKSEGVYERSDGVCNTSELPENLVHQSLVHAKQSTNVSVRDSSAVEDAIAYQAAGEENDEYDTGSRLSENTCVGMVDCRDGIGSVEGDLDVHMSKGCSPILADLSDKLDAAWTGEGHSVVVQAMHVTSQGQELASVPAPENTGGDKELAFKSDSFENSSVPSAVKIESAADSVSNMQDKDGPEAFQVSMPSSPIKSFDSSEDVGSWIGAPFSNLYKAYEKVSQGPLVGSASRFLSLSGYIPTFVSSVNQLCGQGGARLLLPTGVNDIVIVIYDDEPTSIIAYALTSYEYESHVSDKASDKDKQRERDWDKEKETGNLSVMDGAISHPLQPLHGSSEIAEISYKDKSFGSEDGFTSGSKGTGIADPFLDTKAMHVKVSFSDENPFGKVKYTVTCYYAKQFDALRRKCCPTELEFIRSLCRCKKWGAQGGKSNVFFAKTLDERFIVKQVTKTELESFIKFAPEYFKYLSDSLSTGSPTCLAKILGIYQVTAKHVKGGKEVRMDLMVMENLLFGRNVTRVYDLKGSARSRYNPDSKGSNAVLLDQNLLEAMPTSPIFVGNKAKRLLERAVWNDTSFLASVDVMDYSLLVGVDEERRELVLGIIDFMRQYTWDKHLETWVKASGILGGPKNTSPTVISPKQYKKRFRKAMSTYFLMVPDQWSPPTIIPIAPQIDACDEKFSVSIQEDIGKRAVKSKA